MSELHPTRIASASLYLQFHIISHSSSSFGMDYAIAYLQSSTHLRCIATACFWYGLQYTESANPLAVLSRVGMNHSADEEWWMNDGWLWFMIDYEWWIMTVQLITSTNISHVFPSSLMCPLPKDYDKIPVAVVGTSREAMLIREIEDHFFCRCREIWKHGIASGKHTLKSYRKWP